MSDKVDLGLAKAYAMFTEEVEQRINAAVAQRGQEMKAEIVENSPVKQPDYVRQSDGEPMRYGRYKTGRKPGTYKKGWRVGMKKKNGKITYTAKQSKGDAGLVHLLELGHDTWNGGHAEGHLNAEAAQEKYAKLLHKDIEEILNGNGGG